MRHLGIDIDSMKINFKKIMTKSKDIKKEAQLVDNELENVANQETTAEQVAQEEIEASEVDVLQTKVAELEARVAELEDLKLRQMAEFDNFRRRTNKEKLELMTTAGERIFCDMLPLVDDFERAKVAMAKSEDINAVREGIDLIYNKFIAFLGANNVKAIDTTDADFNTDLHEAITTFAAGEDKKGKVIDCTQTGYTLGEKVIRFARWLGFGGDV